MRTKVARPVASRQVRSTSIDNALNGRWDGGHRQETHDRNGAQPARPMHPSVVCPEGYPDEVPPLGAGLIHAYAGMFLHDFVRSRLATLHPERRTATAFDVPLYRSPNDFVVPDVYAYLRLPLERGDAATYHIKYDGPPDLVIEIISVATWRKDIGLGRRTEIKDKKDFYRQIGVTEYWIYDPEGRRKDKTCLFEGFRLDEYGRYRPIAPESGQWMSTVLQAGWSVGERYTLPDGRRFPLMRLICPDTGGHYPIHEETEAKLQKTESTLQKTESTLHETKVVLHETQDKLAASESETSRLRALLAMHGIDADALPSLPARAENT